jgi:predicted dienelactone hydrolase
MSLWILWTVMSCLFACNPTPETLLDATATIPQASTIAPEATATIPQVTRTAIWFAAASPTTSNVSVSFPFSERGPYWTGNRVYTFVDESRNGRRIEVQIYYPALKEANEQGGIITRNATPDMSGSPYPLILTGPGSGDYIFKSHLASHGFATAIVRFPDSYTYPDFQTVDHPRDFLFTLDQIASVPLEGLEKVIDSDRVGVTGFSGDGFISLALSGVRIDPGFYLSFCERASNITPPISEWYINFWCGLSRKWEDFTVHVGEEITNNDDGLWQALTDDRIRAVMPMAADGAQIYGERGLATADRPMLLIAATEDEYVPYQIESRYIFEHVGAPELFMVSFIGETHEMPFSTEPSNSMKHFAVAFFGYYLQGRADYRDYFSEEFVNQFDNLAWGIYRDE